MNFEQYLKQPVVTNSQTTRDLVQKIKLATGSLYVPPGFVLPLKRGPLERKILAYYYWERKKRLGKF